MTTPNSSAGASERPRAAAPRAAARWRLERTTRLLGAEAMQKLAAGHVAVFGLGGVGSPAVETLARSGVGRLTLVDFDRVCVTNINRQFHALAGTVGEFKADLMEARVRAIRPETEVRAFREFYDRATSDRLLDPPPDVVLDCIDNVTAKMHLVASCIARGIPVVTALGAAAKLDPTRVRIVPLTATHTDPLGRALRKFIRRKHDVTDEHLAGVVAIFSDEPVLQPIESEDGLACGVDCVCPGGRVSRHACTRRHVIHGSVAYVTAAFGCAASAAAVQILLGRSPFSPRLACEHCGHELGGPPFRIPPPKKKR